MHRKVLLIAYYWPPSNAACTHRPLRFGQAQLDRVPEGVKVVRAPHWDPWFAVQHWRAQRLAAGHGRANQLGMLTHA